MTTRVRIYFHSGYEPAPAAPGSPREPYLDRCILDLDGKGKTSTPAPKGSTVVYVQTDDEVHIEIRPPQDQRPADTYSPILDGNAHYMIGAEWTVSVLEAGVLSDPSKEGA